MALEELVGACLVFGIPGTALTPAVVRHFKETHAGGLILYRHNFESPGQMVKLVEDLEDQLGRRLLVVVDHEGGRVIMFKDAVTIFPDNRAAGLAGQGEWMRKQGEIEALELRRYGIDVNLGPVLDVLTAAYSPNIGIRSYGTDPVQVADLGAARIRGMQENGLSACAKHFPGKGHAPLDAHLDLPVIPSSWEEMRRIHLLPFLRAIEEGVDVIMTSHPIYSRLDPGVPVTFSKRIVKEFLRGELKYKGVISSDDLEMHALDRFGSIGEAAVRAKEAGHDLLLVCHTPEKQAEVFRSLMDACNADRLSRRELEESANRIEQLKRKRRQRFAGGVPKTDPGGAELARKMAASGTVLLRDREALLPLAPSHLEGKSVAIVFPRFSEVWKRVMIEDVFLDETRFLKERMAAFSLTPEIHLVGLEKPSLEEIATARKLASVSDYTFLFLYDAHLFPANRTLLEAVQGAAKNLVVIPLRDPYDVEFVSPKAAVVTAYGFRAVQIQAALEKIIR